MTPTVKVNDLPLHDLFVRLREAGLLLGISEYQLLLRALKAGFGLPDRKALARLCRTLWVKSAEEAVLFDYHFAHIIDQQFFTRTMDEHAPPKSMPFAQEATHSEGFNEPGDNTSDIPPENDAALSPGFVVDMDDEIQIAQAIQTTGREDELPTRHFLLTSDYFPVTHRQMKRSWRYLRQPVREGPPAELDIETTIKKIGQQGVLLEPVVIPRRVNRTELLLLLDQDGSMVPFHMLSRRLAETALRGGRLGKAGIYYFHNCPDKYLYHDPNHQHEVPLEQVLCQTHAYHAGVLIFSDAGAARGGFSSERIELTRQLVNHIKQHMRYIVWLNPMPRSRWGGTTSAEIAKMIPMFEMSRQGMDNAIRVLLGRSTHGEEQK